MKTCRRVIDLMEHNHLSDEAKEAIAIKTEHFMESVHNMHPDMVNNYLMEVEDIICYPPLTIEVAEKYVAELQNKDGSRGGHWTLQQVRDLANKYPELKHFNCLDFYVAINIMHSDYWCADKQVEYYIKLASDFLDDKDAPKNKLVRYMVCMKH